MTTRPQTALERVYWIGGSPCAGKSSIGRSLSRQYGLELYSIDEAWPRQMGRLSSRRQPALSRWLESSWDQRWMQPVHFLLEQAKACYREHFALVLEDLRQSAPGTPLLVEGTAILPDAIAALPVARHRAFWLIPSGEFQRCHYQQRDWVKGILADCRDPEAAFARWMQRDVEFARWVSLETERLGFDNLLVDGGQSIGQNARRIATHFRLGVAH